MCLLCGHLKYVESFTETLAGLRGTCFGYTVFNMDLFFLFFLMGSFLQDVMQQATNAILRGGTIQAPTVSAKTIAEQLAEKINAKLNYVPIEKQEEEKQDGGQNESFKRYEEELEINDFPQASKHFANDYHLTSIAWTVITPITCFVSSSYSS